VPFSLTNGLSNGRGVGFSVSFPFAQKMNANKYAQYVQHKGGILLKIKLGRRMVWVWADLA